MLQITALETTTLVTKSIVLVHRCGSGISLGYARAKLFGFLDVLSAVSKSPCDLISSAIQQSTSLEIHLSRESNMENVYGFRMAQEQYFGQSNFTKRNLSSLLVIESYRSLGRQLYGQGLYGGTQVGKIF